MKFDEITEPGFYWYKFTPSSGWMIAYVERDHRGMYTRNYCGASQASHFNAGEYLGGPLRNPTDVLIPS